VAPHIPNKVSLTNYTDGTILLEGSVLDGLRVLAWRPAHGQHLAWMDECGIITLTPRPMSGFLFVNMEELAARSLDTARRAALTNAADLEQALKAWPDVPLPDSVWLGVERRENYRSDRRDVGLPKWARGHRIVEADEGNGCFAALGYCRPGEESRFKVADPYYCQLMGYE
jgi:hypothetical protein